MATRVCSKCGLEKNIEQFPLRNNLTHRRQSYCVDCRKTYGASWYERNKEYQKANARKHSIEYRAAAKEYVWNYLLTRHCIQCGESNPVVLEFHHARGEKENDIAHLINQSGSSLNMLIAELKKCDVLCANCHRILTAKERGWFRGRK